MSKIYRDAYGRRRDPSFLEQALENWQIITGMITMVAIAILVIIAIYIYVPRRVTAPATSNGGTLTAQTATDPTPTMAVVTPTPRPEPTPEHLLVEYGHGHVTINMPGGRGTFFVISSKDEEVHVTGECVTPIHTERTSNEVIRVFSVKMASCDVTMTGGGKNPVTIKALSPMGGEKTMEGVYLN